MNKISVALLAVSLVGCADESSTTTDNVTMEARPKPVKKARSKETQRPPPPLPGAEPKKPGLKTPTATTTKGKPESNATSVSQQGSSRGGAGLHRGPRARRSAASRAAPRAKPSRGFTMRAGAIRLSPAKKKNYEVSPDTGLSLRVAGLDAALGSRRIGAEVKPFKQDGASKHGHHVTRGGEIVALGLALALQRSGWFVNMLERATLKRRKKAPRDDLRTTAIAFKLRVTGKVAFYVGDKAHLNGTITFAAGKDLRVQVKVAAVEALPKEGARSRRSSMAARGVLKSFIRMVVSDPGLSSALVAYLKRG